MRGINSTANKPPASCRGLGLLMWTEIEVGSLAVELDEIERADGERGKDCQASHEGPCLQVKRLAGLTSERLRGPKSVVDASCSPTGLNPPGGFFFPAGDVVFVL